MKAPPDKTNPEEAVEDSPEGDPLPTVYYAFAKIIWDPGNPKSGAEVDPAVPEGWNDGSC